MSAPNNHAEQATIGAALLDADALRIACDVLPSANLFERGDHRRLWRAILDMRMDGGPIDLITLAERLGENLDSCGGQAYLSELVQSVPGTANAGMYAETVAKAAEQRRLRDVLSDASARADAGEPVEAIFGDLQKHALKTDRQHWPAPLDLSALARTEPHAPQFVVDDWLPAGYATLLAGHGGAGKSAIALYLAVCIALGLPWMNIPTQRRRVLFVSCEDRVDVLHWRLSRICAHLDIDMAMLAEHLDVLDVVGRDAILWTPRAIDSGEPARAYRALREAMTATGAEVLMVDGISDAYGGGENVRAEVRAFIASLLALIDPKRGAVLLLGHVDKATANASASSNGYSGSTAWHNSVRARWYLYAETRHDGEGTEKTGDLLLEQQKANHGEAGQGIRLHWDGDAHLFVGQQIGSDTALDRKARDRRERTSILDAMRAIKAANDYVPAAAMGSRTAFHVLAARPEFDTERMPSTTAGRKRFWRHIEALRAMGEIREGSITRTDRHRIITLELAPPHPDSDCGHAGHG